MSQQQDKLPRIKTNWPVSVSHPQGEIEGVTTAVSPTGVFIRCPKPLKLNEVFDMTIGTPERSLVARGEVVWTNQYGPDDDVMPRGMWVRFLVISNEDRSLIATILEKNNLGKVADEYMRTLNINSTK
jgi:hypothetical protein